MTDAFKTAPYVVPTTPRGFERVMWVQVTTAGRIGRNGTLFWRPFLSTSNGPSHGDDVCVFADGSDEYHGMMLHVKRRYWERDRLNVELSDIVFVADGDGIEFQQWKTDVPWYETSDGSRESLIAKLEAAGWQR